MKKIVRIGQWSVVLGLVAGLLVLEGCVSASVTRLSQQEFPPISADEVQVFYSPKDAPNIPGSYVKVAVMRIQEPWTFTDDTSGVVKKARKEAARLGANGIIIGQFNAPDNPDFHVGEATEQHVNRLDDTMSVPVRTDPDTQEKWVEVTAIHY